jgi:hypothetical protein
LARDARRAIFFESRIQKCLAESGLRLSVEWNDDNHPFTTLGLFLQVMQQSLNQGNFFRSWRPRKHGPDRTPSFTSFGPSLRLAWITIFEPDFQSKAKNFKIQS